MIDVFEGMVADRKTQVVILTGEGKGFCAGADIRADPGERYTGAEGLGRMAFSYRVQELLARMMSAISECDKPVIAAVNGVAVGGGFGIALASDIRIASSAARFGSVFIKLGISSCDVGKSYFLERLVGAGMASELMMTGRIIDAAEALNIRLVNRVVEPEALIETCIGIAREIRENAEYGVWMTKKGIRTNMDAPSLRAAMELENRTQILGAVSGATEEAIKAFAEGRKPQWKPL
jgi:enoyl-CoA hydratase